MEVYSFSYQSKFNKGYLLKFVFSEALIGYSCLQSWPQLGDPDLEQLSEEFKTKITSPMAAQVLRLAMWDGRARRDGEFLNQNSEKISSHYLLTSYNTDLTQLKEQGYSHLKVKIRPYSDFSQEYLSEVKDLGFKVRLDCNESFELEALKRWFDKHTGLIDMVEFIEDPISFTREGWSELKDFGLKLALDRATDVDKAVGIIDYKIIKPLVESEERAIEKCQEKDIKYVFTHNMDHFFGRAMALALAQKNHEDPLLQKVGGYQWPEEDEGGPWEINGPHIKVNGLSGVGLDDYLQGLDWQLHAEH